VSPPGWNLKLRWKRPQSETFDSRSVFVQSQNALSHPLSNRSGKCELLRMTAWNYAFHSLWQARRQDLAAGLSWFYLAIINIQLEKTQISAKTPGHWRNRNVVKSMPRGSKTKRGQKPEGGVTFFKFNIGCMQQQGGQTWNGGTDFKWGAGHHCPPAGDDPVLRTWLFWRLEF